MSLLPSRHSSTQQTAISLVEMYSTQCCIIIWRFAFLALKNPYSSLGWEGKGCLRSAFPMYYILTSLAAGYPSCIITLLGEGWSTVQAFYVFFRLIRYYKINAKVVFVTLTREPKASLRYSLSVHTAVRYLCLHSSTLPLMLLNVPSSLLSLIHNLDSTSNSCRT